MQNAGGRQQGDRVTMKIKFKKNPPHTNRGEDNDDREDDEEGERP